MFISGDGLGGEGLHYSAVNYQRVIIFLHGLGDSAQGWESSMEYLIKQSPKLANSKIVLPTAPEMSVTFTGGAKMRAWFDIRDLNRSVSEDLALYEASSKRIQRLINYEVEHCGIRPSHIILGGFSQGGSMSYFAGLTQSREALGGVVALSGWTPDGKNIKSWANIQVTKSTRILHIHGEADQIVRFSNGAKSVEALRIAGFNVTVGNTNV